MMEEFQKIPLGDLVKILDAKRKPITKSDRKPGKYPYYGASGIADYIDDFIFDGTFLLLSEDGDNLRTRNTPIAFIVKGQFWVNNHAHILEANSKNLTEYLCYALQVADIDSFISGSTRPKLTQGDIRKILISTPPLPEQKAIAHILGTLDDKIELNRQMNQTLESMAQALFKSWFVDFDPVMDNLLAGQAGALASNQEIPDELQAMAEKRQLVPDSKKLISNNPELAAKFPSSFVFNETLGKWIPEGWEDVSIYKLINVTYGAPFASKLFNSDGIGKPIIRIRDLKTGTPQNWSTEIHSKGILITRGDVVVGMDAEFRPCIWFGKEGYLNQRLFKASSKKDHISNYFIYYSLEPLLQYEEQAQVGTTVAHLGKKDIDKFRIINPEEHILKEYTKMVDPILESFIVNHSELSTLTQLRDRLLPELISGRVRVKELYEWKEQKLAMVAENRANYNSKS